MIGMSFCSRQGESGRQLELVSAVFALSVVATFVLSVSCAVRKPVSVAFGRAHCPAQTLALLEKNSAALHSLKGTLRVHFDMKESAYRGGVQAGLIAQRPDRARLKFYAGFSNLLDVAVDGDSLWALLPSKSTLLIGSVEGAAVPFSGGLIVTALREALFPRRFCIADCKIEREGARICRLEENFSNGKRISSVEVRTGRLRRIDLVDADGNERVTVRYKDYRRSGKIRFPHDITVLFPLMSLEVRLLFDRVQLNVPIDTEALRLEVFPGITVRKFEQSPDVEEGDTGVKGGKGVKGEKGEMKGNG